MANGSKAPWKTEKERNRKRKRRKVKSKRNPSPEDPSANRKRIEAARERARQYEEDLAKLEDFRKRSNDARQSKVDLHSENAADIRFYNDGVRMYEDRTKSAPRMEEEVDSHATGEKPKRGWRRNVLKPIN